MFTVRKLPPPEHRLQPILSGLTFGFFDQPIHFEVQAMDAPGPFLVEFIARRDKSRNAFEISSERASDSTLKVSFFNPAEGGSSGLLAPVILVVAGGFALSFVFIIDVVGAGDAVSYRMTYEFGEAPFSDATNKVAEAKK